MDFGAIIAAVIVISTGAGSWFQGRKTGTTTAITTASDVVGMLATQVGELRAQVAIKDAQIEQLKIRIETLARHQQDDERPREGHSPGGTDDPEGS